MKVLDKYLEEEKEDVTRKKNKMKKERGVYPVRPPVPAVGGYEGVGEIYALGSAVRNLSVGDWVIPLPPSFGTWQTYVVKEANALHKVRKDIPMEYAATVTANPLTALLMMEDFVKLTSGDVIVQNGATSMVGQSIIQLARIRGIRSINIIRDSVFTYVHQLAYEKNSHTRHP
ncbi:hypothetical protein AMTR_s00023p00224360 [Amborella trichopoda]|uniref:Alcohol dehydrogenase-like N-terminal domain-containing protein n=1 Tax=Amborella trichopoda TaxID=13333 RepID=W1NIW9_AMBTC|nr:hypothetical protein AMTR_s00023p00224360 [Amborella trichopoda]